MARRTCILGLLSILILLTSGVGNTSCRLTPLQLSTSDTSLSSNLNVKYGSEFHHTMKLLQTDNEDAVADENDAEPDALASEKQSTDAGNNEDSDQIAEEALEEVEREDPDGADEGGNNQGEKGNAALNGVEEAAETAEQQVTRENDERVAGDAAAANAEKIAREENAGMQTNKEETGDDEDPQTQSQPAEDGDAAEDEAEQDSGDDAEQHKDDKSADDPESSVVKVVNNLVGDVNAEQLSDTLKEHINTAGGAVTSQLDESADKDATAASTQPRENNGSKGAAAQGQTRTQNGDQRAAGTQASTDTTATDANTRTEAGSNTGPGGVVTVSDVKTGTSVDTRHQDDENGMNSAKTVVERVEEEKGADSDDAASVNGVASKTEDTALASQRDEHDTGINQDEEDEIDKEIGTVDNGAGDDTRGNQDRNQNGQTEGQTSQGSSQTSQSKSQTGQTGQNEGQASPNIGQTGQTEGQVSQSKGQTTQTDKTAEAAEDEDEELADEIGLVDDAVRDDKKTPGQSSQTIVTAQNGKDEPKTTSSGTATSDTTSTTTSTAVASPAQDTESAKGTQQTSTVQTGDGDETEEQTDQHILLKPPTPTTTKQTTPDTTTNPGTTTATPTTSSSNQDSDDTPASSATTSTTPSAVTASVTTNSDKGQDTDHTTTPSASTPTSPSIGTAPGTTTPIIHPTLASQFEAGSGAAAKPEAGAHTVGSISSGGLHPDTLHGQVTKLLPSPSSSDPSNPGATDASALIDKLIDKTRVMSPAKVFATPQPSSNVDAASDPALAVDSTEDLDEEQAVDGSSPKKGAQDGATHDGIALVHPAGVSDAAAVELESGLGDLTVAGSKPGVAHLPGQAFGNFEADTHKVKKEVVEEEMETTWLMRHTGKLWALATLVIVGALALVGMLAYRQLSGRRHWTKGPSGSTTYAPVATRDQLTSKSNDSSSSWNADWDADEDEETGQDWGGATSGSGSGPSKGPAKAMKLGPATTATGVLHRTTKAGARPR